MKNSRPLTSVIIFALLLLAAHPVWACATCFGDPDSPQTKGLNMAILTLLGVTYTLFGGMLATAFFLWRNARAKNHLPPEHTGADAAQPADLGISHG